MWMLLFYIQHERRADNNSPAGGARSCALRQMARQTHGHS
jgi:hypothetical protein